ncbi:CopG family transcriptional regulator [Saccharibacter sp. 17.LH.SD]|uniref:type II toxin-antitoxin system HicB family antitoxin n=1 Tax=Saccharibacter sp. 17.LH.SD TaxID=2689393 RepID=UPI00136FCC8B|nr:type II toxin-antitoxin system HicB family antitoxin [Saccharibacter sp. 17.LH.SD]MXV43479.1 CopG family transcriptional regulator [Saccharibacter sp. 17.LH.SD]
MTQYLAVISKDPDSDYGVHFPDFPGCVTAGETIDEARRMAEEALSGHIALMREDGDVIPAPSSYEDIMKDPDNHGLFVCEISPEDYDPMVRVNVTLPRSVLEAIGKGRNRSAFLAQAARERLGLAER